jgi:hypothetical protein
MQTNHLVFDRLVASRLVQLRQDESMLDRTFERLLSSDTQLTLKLQFLSMLAEVEARVSSLDEILDHMQSSEQHFRCEPAMHDRSELARPTGDL